MKICIVGDVHFSTYSSILRKRGEWYSERLENCIRSINWAENVARENNCDCIVYLGDFFDKPELNAEELAAFSEIRWDEEIKRYFLIGNHEAANWDLSYSSAHLLWYIPNSTVITKPVVEYGYKVKLIFLPYVDESHRKTLPESIRGAEAEHGMCFITQECKENIIFSHNDIKGINYGKFVSVDGFDINDIKQNCSLFVNGHLHNKGWVEPGKILNVGNLTGQNFSEDALKYQHSITILDTDSLELQDFVNPYAYNFYKIEINSKEDLTEKLNNPITNSAVVVKTSESLLASVKTTLEQCENIKNYRIIIVPEESHIESKTQENPVEIDYINQFKEYIINQLGDKELVSRELQEILK